MNRTLLRCLPLLVTPMLACGEEAGDTGADATDGAPACTEADVQTLAVAATTVSEEAARAVTAGGASVSTGGSFAGVGDCTWSYSISGTPMSGDIVLALDHTPCGGAVDSARGSGEVEVTTGELSGTYAVTGREGAVTIALSGAREASIALDTDRRAVDADVSWQLHALEATAVGGVLDDWGVAMDYGRSGASGDRAWALDASGDGEGQIEGSLTGPSGVTCTVSGAVGALSVVCSEP